VYTNFVPIGSAEWVVTIMAIALSSCLHLLSFYTKKPFFSHYAVGMYIGGLWIIEFYFYTMGFDPLLSLF
jgi:hypothetical protein